MSTQQPDFNIIFHYLNGLRREILHMPIENDPRMANLQTDMSNNQRELMVALQRFQHQIQDQIKKSQEQTRQEMHQMQDQMQHRMQLIWDEMRVMRDQLKETRDLQLQTRDIQEQTKDAQEEVRELHMEYVFSRLRIYFTNNQCRQCMVTMRIYNSSPGNYATHVYYPPGMNCNELPKTRADLMRLTREPLLKFWLAGYQS